MQTVWYLIIAYSNGGIVVIPEPTESQCKQVADWVQDTAHVDTLKPGPYCVAGIAFSPAPVSGAAKR